MLKLPETFAGVKNRCAGMRQETIPNETWWHWVSFRFLVNMCWNQLFKIRKRMLMVGSLILSDGSVVQGPTIAHVCCWNWLCFDEKRIHLRCFCLCSGMPFLLFLSWALLQLAPTTFRIREYDVNCGWLEKTKIAWSFHLLFCACLFWKHMF